MTHNTQNGFIWLPLRVICSNWMKSSSTGFFFRRFLLLTTVPQNRNQERTWAAKAVSQRRRRRRRVNSAPRRRWRRRRHPRWWWCAVAPPVLLPSTADHWRPPCPPRPRPDLSIRFRSFHRVSLNSSQHFPSIFQEYHSKTSMEDSTEPSIMKKINKVYWSVPLHINLYLNFNR